MTMTKERDNPTAEAEVDSIPVDVECIREGLIHALELPLATTTLRRSTRTSARSAAISTS